MIVLKYNACVSTVNITSITDTKTRQNYFRGRGE